eukprot:122927-Amorphochlora_amoeboformis.AAC.1
MHIFTRPEHLLKRSEEIHARIYTERKDTLRDVVKYMPTQTVNILIRAVYKLTLPLSSDVHIYTGPLGRREQEEDREERRKGREGTALHVLEKRVTILQMVDFLEENYKTAM